MAKMILELDANTQKVRDAMDRLVADARNRPITVPIQGGGSGAVGAGGAIVPNQATTAIIGGAGRTSVSTSGAVDDFNRFGSRLGVGDVLGVGAVASGFSNVISAGRQYAIDRALAGGNQRSQLEATLAYRERVAGSFGFVSRSVAFLQDPTGEREARINASLRTADALDEQRAGRFQARDFAAGQADRLSVSRANNPYQERQRAAEAAYNAELRQIKNLERAEIERTQKVLEAKRAELDASRPQRARDLYFAGKAPSTGGFLGGRFENAYQILEQQDLAAGNAAVREAESQRQRTFGPMTAAAEALRTRALAEVDREESFRRRGALAGYGFEARGAFYDIIGDQAGSRRTREAAGNFAAFQAAGRSRMGFGEWAAMYGARAASTMAGIVDEAREQYFATDDRRRSRAVTEALLRRDPLGAQLESLERERQRAIYGKTTAETAEINAGFRARRQLAETQDADDRTARMESLQARERILSRRLAGGMYGDVAGQALSVREEAYLRVNDLNREDLVRNRPLIEQTLKNAGNEVELIAKAFFNRFKPTEVDINRTAIGAEGGREVLDVLNDMRTILADIRARGFSLTAQ